MTMYFKQPLKAVMLYIAWVIMVEMGDTFMIQLTYFGCLIMLLGFIGYELKFITAKYIN